LSCAKE